MPVAANHGTDMISKIVPIGSPMAWNTPEPQYHLGRGGRRVATPLKA